MSEVRRARRIFKVFGDEAGRFVLKAVNSQDLLNKTMGLVGKGSKFAGSMQRELVAKMAGTETALGRIKAVADVALIQMGDAILPIIKKLTPDIIKIVWKFREWIKLNPHIMKNAIIIIGITAAVVALSVAVGLVLSVLGTLASVLAVVFSPVGLVIAAIAVGFVLLYKHSESFRNIISSIVGVAKSLFTAFKEGGLDKFLERLGIIFDQLAHQPTYLRLSKLSAFSQTGVLYMFVFLSCLLILSNMIFLSLMN